MFRRRAGLLASVLAITVVLGTGVASPARGETPSELAAPAVHPEAHRLYEEGLAHYRRGEYADAISKLERAYLLVPAPTLLYDLAQAHRLNQDCAQALEHYRRYLDIGATGTLRVRAQARLTEMQACAAAHAVTPGPELHPQPDLRLPPSPVPPAAQGTAALASPRPTGERGQRGAADPGDTIDRSKDERSDRGEKLVVSARRGRSTGLVLAGTALALASLSGYFAWRTMDASAHVSDTFRPGNSWDEADMRAQERGQSSYKLELATAGGALVLGGIAAWLLFRE